MQSDCFCSLFCGIPIVATVIIVLNKFPINDSPVSYMYGFMLLLKNNYTWGLQMQYFQTNCKRPAAHLGRGYTVWPRKFPVFGRQIKDWRSEICQILKLFAFVFNFPISAEVLNRSQ